MEIKQKVIFTFHKLLYRKFKIKFTDWRKKLRVKGIFKYFNKVVCQRAVIYFIYSK